VQTDGEVADGLYRAGGVDECVASLGACGACVL
jgi:hypothetical protein